MTVEQFNRETQFPVVVSTSGQARQFRVQVRVTTSESWHCYATFPRAEQAWRCIRQLSTEGRLARLVAHSIAPAAA